MQLIEGLTGEGEGIYISTLLSAASELMYYLTKYGKGIVGYENWKLNTGDLEEPTSYWD